MCPLRKFVPTDALLYVCGQIYGNAQSAPS